MEWVEVTGKTVAAAKDVALDRLGVAEDDALPASMGSIFLATDTRASSAMSRAAPILMTSMPLSVKAAPIVSLRLLP